MHAMGGDGFLTLMNKTLEEAMMADGFSQIFLNDFVAPIARVNYGQSVRINGFAGMFTLFGVELDSSFDAAKDSRSCLVCRGGVFGRGGFGFMGRG